MIDIAIVVLYVAFIVAIGIIKGRNTNTTQAFALGPQSFPPIVLIVATFSTLVDGNDTIGIASNTFSTGLLFAAVCLGPVISLLLVAFVVAPKMSPFAGLISSGDVMGKLYGRQAKVATGAGVIIEGVILTAGQVKAIGYVLSQAFGLYEHWGVILGGIIVLAYSARGGMLSIGITDIIQFAALIIAIPMICGVAVVSVGGFGALFERIPSSHLTLFPSSEEFWVHFSMFAALGLPAIYPGAMQRILMSRTSNQIRNTFFVTANICAAFYVVAAIIGFVAIARNLEGDPQLAMPYVINGVLPVGLIGFAVVGLLAVITSTVGSHLNMAAVAFSNDIIAPLRGEKLNDQRFILVSKYFAIFVGVISILLATLFESVLETVFFVIFWGNPLFFPGMFWGIMGLRASPRAFWIGMGSAAATTLLYWLYAPPDFFSSLLSCAVNSAVLLASRMKVTGLQPLIAFSKADLLSLRDKTVSWFLDGLKVESSKFRRYKSIFLWFIIAQASLPFFFWQKVNGTMCAYFSILLVAALLSFLLLFSEWINARETPQIRLWSAATFVFFAVQTGMMLAQSYYNYFWLLCTVLVATMMIAMAYTARVYLVLWGLASLATGWILLALGITTPGDEINAVAVAFYICSPLACLLIAWQFDSKTVKDVQDKNSNLGHMLGTPLASYDVKAEILKETVDPVLDAYRWALEQGYSGPRISKKHERALRIAGSELEQITDELRENVKFSLADTPSSSEQSKSVVCSVNSCLNNTVERFFKNDETRRSLVELDLEGEIKFLGNRDEFSYVLNELLKNAFEEIAIAGRGRLFIQTIEDERVVIIEDTAKGISAKNLRRVFKKRFTTKPNGHGLGLHYCKARMEELGGSIECTAKEGEFTRFTLSFPNFHNSAQESTL